jgi:predicted phosphodiesterase
MGFTTKAAAGTMFAGTFAPTLTSMIGMGGIAEAAGKKVEAFTFGILTDGHLYDIKDHKFDAFLAEAVDNMNKLNPRPDFVIYGGDIGQTGKETELKKGKSILDKLKMPYKVIPGEHDYYLDLGKAWRGMFGDENWSFMHKGVLFMGFNSIKVPDFWTARGLSGHERMGLFEELECHQCGRGLWGIGGGEEWGSSDGIKDLKKFTKDVSADTPVVIFTHSPLWDYYPRWNYQTYDAPEIRAILGKFDSVISIHGHVHQVLYNKIGNISSAGLVSTSWPWPYPPVQLKYPDRKMNRSDPGNFQDGLTGHHVNIATNGTGTMFYDEFEANKGSTIPANLQNGMPL